jgi:hypothetical protein
MRPLRVTYAFVRRVGGRCSGRSDENRFLIPEEPHKTFMKNPPNLWVGLGAFFETLSERVNCNDLAVGDF